MSRGVEVSVASRSPAGRPGRPALWTFASLLLVPALAAGLRLYKLGEQDYWLDEIHTMVDSVGRRAEYEALPHGVILPSVLRFTEPTAPVTWLTVWRGMEADSHPPIFFLFFHTWQEAFGDSEFTARLPSTVFSVASILMVALVARAQGRGRNGLWIALLLSLTYAHLLMAQQARPYTLALLFTSASYWALVKMEIGWAKFGGRQKLLWSTLYAATCFLAVLTHYFAAFALLGHIAVVLCSHNKGLTRAWTGAVVVAGAAFALVWGRQVLAQLDFIESHIWIVEQHSYHAWGSLLRLADLPLRIMFAHIPFRLNYAGSLGGLALAAGLGLLLWRRHCRAAIVFGAWYAAPAITFAVIDLTTARQTLSHLRYVSVAAPGLAGLLVLAVLHLRRPLRRLCLTAFVVAVLLTLRLPTQDNPHNRQAASLITERVPPDALLVFDAVDWPPFWVSQIYHNVVYYLPEYLDGHLPPCLLLRDRPTRELTAQMERYSRIVVVSPRIGAFPNPVPGRFQPVDRTPYVHQIGFIYLFVAGAEPGQ